MAGSGATVDPGTGASGGRRNGKDAPIKERISKDIGYVATGTIATQVLSISKTADTGTIANQTQQTADPVRVKVKNPGRTPIIVAFGYEAYTAETAHGAVHYLQAMILPGDEVVAPLRGIIPTADRGEVYDGTAVDFTDVTNYVASGTALNDASLEAGEIGRASCRERVHMP